MGAYENHGRDKANEWDTMSVTRRDLLKRAMRNETAAEEVHREAVQNLKDSRENVARAVELAQDLLNSVPKDAQNTRFYHEIRELLNYAQLGQQ